MSRYPKRKRKVALYVEATIDKGEDDDDWSPAKEKQLTILKRARYVGKHKKEKTFRLMDLPGELRNKVYKFILCQPSGELWIGQQASKKMPCTRANFSLSSVDTPTGQRDYLATTLNNFAILRASKRVNAEAMSILYGQKFNFLKVDAMQNFLLRLSPTAIGLLRDIDCNCYFTPQVWKFLPAVFSLLRSADRLEHLRVGGMRELHCKALKVQLLKTPGQDDMTAATWDAHVARLLAKELYAHMYPWIETSIRNKGAKRTMQILDVFGSLFTRGPRTHPDFVYGGVIVYGSFHLKTPNEAIWLESRVPERSEERASAMRAAVGEELARLVAEDAVRT